MVPAMAGLLLPPPPLAPDTGPIADAALLLDFDGTLVEIAPTPDAVRVAPDLPRLLQRLSAGLDGALAVIRGVSAWRIAEPKDIEDIGSYYLEFSYKLDVSLLPRPMQIGLQSGFALSIEQKRNFAADFSLK